MYIYIYNVYICIQCIYIYIYMYMKNTLKKHPNLKILINHMANDQFVKGEIPFLLVAKKGADAGGAGQR